MDSKPQESGLDELMRLSRQTARWGRETAEKEKQKAEHSQKVQGVVSGLREISFSVAIQQLEQVAEPKMVKEIAALASKPGVEDLRKVISDLTRDLENRVSKISGSNPEIASLEQSIKTLAILIGLFFSLK